MNSCEACAGKGTEIERLTAALELWHDYWGHEDPHQCVAEKVGLDTYARPLALEQRRSIRLVKALESGIAAMDHIRRLALPSGTDFGDSNIAKLASDALSVMRSALPK